jgi:UDP-N-acetyl-D-mannosaminuronate dehydrogenase
MAKEKVLIVGLGEVGQPLLELVKESGWFEVYGFDVDEAKIQALKQTLPINVDIMHICLPCANQEEFVTIVKDYIERFQPKLTIINSTVPPKTTITLHRVSEKAQIAYSPIRGVHKGNDYMKWEIKRWTKYIGGATKEAGEAAREHFEKVGLRTKVLASSTETELAKLFETTYRVSMISCFQEMHRIAVHFKANFDDVVDFLEDTHRVRLDRPVMFPGEIGGHCLIPNAKLLLKSYDSEFLRLVLRSNEKRKKEVKDPMIKEEAEKIRKRAENLQKELMEKWLKKSDGTLLTKKYQHTR